MLDWCAENEIDIEHYEEKNAIREALDNMEEFKMHGGIVYIKDKAVAMTLGCEISPLHLIYVLKKLCVNTTAFMQ